MPRLSSALGGTYRLRLDRWYRYAAVDHVWKRLLYESDPLNREPSDGGIRTLTSIYWEGWPASRRTRIQRRHAYDQHAPTRRIIGRRHVRRDRFTVHMAISIVIGATYGVLFRYEAPNPSASLAWGLLYGAVWWFIGPLTLFPILLGGSFAWTTAEAAGQLPSLVGHLLTASPPHLSFWLSNAVMPRGLRGMCVSLREKRGGASTADLGAGGTVVLRWPRRYATGASLMKKHALPVYTLSGSELAMGASLGNSAIWVNTKGTGAIERIFNARCGECLFGAVSVRYGLASQQIEKDHALEQLEAQEAPSIALHPDGPGSVELHPAYQRRRFSDCGNDSRE